MRRRARRRASPRMTLSTPFLGTMRPSWRIVGSPRRRPSSALASRTSVGQNSEESKPQGIVAILFDLGVSSPQLDRPVRGFSYWADAAPLDMRMDSVQALTAATVVNEYSEADLAALIAPFMGVMGLMHK